MTDYRVKDQLVPDMTADAFLAALRANLSPVPNDAARQVYAYCVARRVSPAFILALFHHESAMGRTGWAALTYSWGNTRPPSFGLELPSGVYDQDSREYYQWLAPRPSGRRYLCSYANWAAGGIATVARLLDHAPYQGRDTVQTIIPVWAPASDGNTPDDYITTVLAFIARHAHYTTPAPPGGTMVLAPPPINTSHPSPNRNGYGGTRRVDALCWHVTAGSESGSLAWLCNPESKASANYLIGKDGTIYELVPPDEDAWANGAVHQPDMSNPLIPKWLAEKVNFNQRTISIEIAKEVSANEQPGGFTAAQYKALVNLSAWLCQRFRLTPDRTHIIGHYQIDSVNRQHCPGLAPSEWFALVASVAALVGGATPPGPTPPAPAVTTPATVWGGSGEVVSYEQIIVVRDPITGQVSQRRQIDSTMQPWQLLSK